MAYKVFQNGFPLNASELNNYLMNQSVMVFASTTARDADLTAPTEGMIVWLQDANKFVYYTGSAWADVVPSTGSGNAIINGAFDIWQRGTSFTPAAGTAGYVADRWNYYRDGSGSAVTMSRQTFTPGTAPVAGYEGQYFFRFDQTTAGTGGTENLLQQYMEDVRTFAGQTVTVSFWAKADAARTLNSQIQQYFGSGGSSRVDQTAVSHSLTTSWARYTATFTVPSVAGKTINAGSYLTLAFRLPVNATGTFDIWGVQVEAGSTATGFKRNGVNIEDELAACQRYYQRFNSINAYGLFGFGKAYNGNTLNLVFSLPVQMRTTPNAIETSAMSTIQYETGSTSGNTPTSITLNAFTSTPSIVGADLNKSGAFSTGAFYFVQAANSTSAYIAFGAEL